MHPTVQNRPVSCPRCGQSGIRAREVVTETRDQIIREGRWNCNCCGTFIMQGVLAVTDKPKSDSK
jgi:uncharacterized Zn finger protein